MMKRKIKNVPTSLDRKMFNVFSYLFLTVLTIYCTIPFWLIIVGSLTTQESILLDGYRLWPKSFSGEAYEILFKAPGALLNAYAVTIGVTVIGTISSLLMMSMAAYVLNSKDFKYRNKVSFFYYFTSIFGGGLVPWYILCIKYLHFKNNFLSLILPIVVNVTYLLILKSYMKSIPDSIYESAKLDGEGDFTIYAKIILPLCKPGMATVGLFTALNYWNDWYNAMLFIDNEKMFPLQYYLNNILTKASALQAAAARSGIVVASIPSEPMKLAMTVIAIGPIILLYPFLQRYFIKGVTIGAVKG